MRPRDRRPQSGAEGQVHVGKRMDDRLQFHCRVSLSHFSVAGPGRARWMNCASGARLASDGKDCRTNPLIPLAPWLPPSPAGPALPGQNPMRSAIRRLTGLKTRAHRRARYGHVAIM